MEDEILEFNHCVIGARGLLGQSVYSALKVTYPNRRISVVKSEALLENLGVALGFVNRKTIFYWCAGRAKASSSKEDCERDLILFALFVERITELNDEATIVFLSSGGTVYGKSPGLVNELSPLNPFSHYSEMKILCEGILQKHNSKALKGLVIRLANVYGAIDSEKASGLVDRILTKRRFNLLVDPASRKQYGHCRDYGGNIVRISQNFARFDSIYETRNLFPNFEYSISEIVQVVTEVTGQPIFMDLGVRSESLELETVTLATNPALTPLEMDWIDLPYYISEFFSTKE
ncbi:MAG: NAD-dependent epimerase/dehydratase family protein [Actinobacteria bacterium]|nr:NAD-dependent epimerase/dehydratase family protein [Actinomycetota bacterium]